MTADAVLREDGPAAEGAAAGRPRAARRGPETGILFRRMLRNAALVLGGKAATALVNLAATALALRTLGVESYGLLVLVHALVQAAGGEVVVGGGRGEPALEGVAVVAAEGVADHRANIGGGRTGATTFPWT